MVSSKLALLVTFFSATALAKPATPTNDFCGFYDEDECVRQEGDVTFSVDNDGLFANPGPFFQCGTNKEFSLIHYPEGDSAGDNPDHCFVFTSDQASFTCNRLTDRGFDPASGGLYRITLDHQCPPTSSKRDIAVEEPTPVLEKRNDNFLRFFDDPECLDHNGDVDFSTSDDGCFAESGQFADFTGDDFGWSLFQYADGNCPGTQETCQNVSSFLPDDPSQEVPCVNLTAIGFKPGTGSYKIQRGGCP